MEESQPDARIFSLRIVSIDYYMTSPIPDVDISYSSFQGGKVKEVPVIRIYGSTPGGQKACCHVHGAMPYLYVPVADIPVQGSVEGDGYKNTVCLAIEKALKLKGSAGSKRQHVHGCDLVRAARFYGYHSQEELFLKIYLYPYRYYPQDISRSASLLLEGAILEKSLQPHESHIPFLLQFLVDYNLYGMGHMHLARLRFRLPVPNNPSSSKTETAGPNFTTATADSQGVLNIAPLSSSQFWAESNIPNGWIWPCPSEYGASSDQGAIKMKRQSTCQLEADTVVDDIVNQQSKMYSSFSQAGSDVKMVQSLIPIWQEEYGRSGVHEGEIQPDPGKPHPGIVLKTFVHGLDYEQKLMELCNRLEEALSTSIDKDGRSILKVEKGNLIGGALECFPSLEDSKFGRNDDVVEGEGEDLALLKWLASSQATENANSDDDLISATILSPLLPVATINKVIERANSNYQDESQKECQDILDSVDNLIDFEGKKLNSPYTDGEKLSQRLNYKIPQVDGAGEDTDSTSVENSSEEEMDIELIRSHGHLVQDVALGSKSKRKRERSLWVPLPFTVSQSKDLDSRFQPADFSVKHKSPSALANADAKTSFSAAYEHQSSSIPAIDCEEIGFSVHTQSRVLSDCSVRDLMRKKRSYRFEQSEYTSRGSKSISCDEEQAFTPRKLEFHTTQSKDEVEPVESINHRPSEFHLKAYCSQPGSMFHNTTASLGLNVGKQDVHATTKCHAIEEQLDDPMIESSVFASTSNICVSKNINIERSLPDHQCSLSVVSEHREWSGSMNSMKSDSPCGREKAILHSMPSISAHGDMEKKKKLENISMSFHMKPPIADHIDLLSENLPIISRYSSLHTDGYNRSAVEPDSQDEFLPFFTGGCKNDVEFPKKCTDSEKLSLELAMGVPVHFQNDGSYSYLLAPAFSAPHVDSVCSWLSSVNAGNLEGDDFKSTEALSSRCNAIRNGSEDSPVPHNSLTLPGSDVASASKSVLNLNQGNYSNAGSEEHPTQPDILLALQDERRFLKQIDGRKFSHDSSQISGISAGSKTTPLSQIGFCDPASFGAGQQLTLFSIEVQAESRGDLQPHPQFDAINIVSIAIQDDSSSRLDTHLLLRDVNKSCSTRDADGISGFEVKFFSEERDLLDYFVKITCSFDPDILIGWDVQGSSLGFLAERALHLGLNLLNKISRTPIGGNLVAGGFEVLEEELENIVPTGSLKSDAVVLEDAIIEDEWGRTHASGVHVGGRIVLNVWRLMRGEVKLNMYTIEAVAEAVLRRKVPFVHWTVLNKWFSSGPGRARYRCIDYLAERAKLNIEVINQLDMINRTSELARVFGIDFYSVLSRGSQYRVESMLLRLAHMQNYIAISPSYQQVASQPAMECLPLVMEPESGFYADPVVVLDFQSLYPSMIIAYNLCFCTCMGKVFPPKTETLGVSIYSPNSHILKDLNQDILVTPNGVMYIPSKIRKGVLPRLLEEILLTRIMIKKAMKKFLPSQKILERIYNARQLALKLIANVTYGYTAAGFSGRMPCAELADSIVQCGRRTLETAISFVNAHDKWHAKVIYGDTDSMFVLLKGRTWREAFAIGQEIATEITAMNPDPVTLKMEKVYQPCFLLTKKRYVGYSYENLDQAEPIYDAKGIETVRRDTCGAVSKMMEKSLRTFFEQQDISKVKEYVHRQWSRILSGRVSIQDFIFAKEVRLGSYSERASSLPPAAIVATKAMRFDPRAEPRYGERIPYVVIHGEPGARLVDLVVHPQELLAIESPYRLNDLYYIKKQIIPALQRAFGLVGADLNQWFNEMPRPIRDASKKFSGTLNSHRTRIDYYYYSKHCLLCGELMQAGSHLCASCLKKDNASSAAVIRRTSKLERDIQHLAAICRHCGGGDWLIDSSVKCTSLACSVYYERRKVQKELLALSSIAFESKLYPKCMVEWF
ncbi:hypothetical protein V2J09_002320 [Rumex salicifolius]